MTLFARSEPLALLIIHAHLAISAIVKRGEYEETALGRNKPTKNWTKNLGNRTYQNFNLAGCDAVSLLYFRSVGV